MSEFGGLEHEAESLAKDHPQEADKGLEAAGQFADRETGNKFDSEIQDASGAAEKDFGGQDQGGQDQGQGGQDQGQGGQDQGQGGGQG